MKTDSSLSKQTIADVRSLSSDARSLIGFILLNKRYPPYLSDSEIRRAAAELEANNMGYYVYSDGMWIEAHVPTDVVRLYTLEMSVPLDLNGTYYMHGKN